MKIRQVTNVAVAGVIAFMLAGGSAFAQGGQMRERAEKARSAEKKVTNLDKLVMAKIDFLMQNREQLQLTEDQVGQPPAQLRLCSVGITPPQPTQGQKTGRTVQLGHSLPLLPDRRVSPVGKENLLHLRRGVSIHLTPGWKPFLRSHLRLES